MVEAELAAAREEDGGARAPTFFGDRGEANTFLFEMSNFCFQVGAGEVHFVTIVFVAGMDGEFRGGESEDEPVVAGIDVAKVENVLEEGTVGFGIRGIENDVSAGQHGVPPKGL